MGNNFSYTNMYATKNMYHRQVTAWLPTNLNLPSAWYSMPTMLNNAKAGLFQQC